jgi:hypothetical protein
MRPTLPVTLVLKGNEFPFTMMLDSGADGIVVPFDLMEAFDLSPEDCVPEAGQWVAGSSDLFLAPDQFGFKFDDDERGTILFSSEVRFAPGLHGKSYGLIGREPALDYMAWRFGNRPVSGFYVWFY